MEPLVLKEEYVRLWCCCYSFTWMFPEGKRDLLIFDNLLLFKNIYNLLDHVIHIESFQCLFVLVCLCWCGGGGWKRELYVIEENIIVVVVYLVGEYREWALHVEHRDYHFAVCCYFKATFPGLLFIHLHTHTSRNLAIFQRRFDNFCPFLEGLLEM
jgi:hypothetical protein